MEMQCRKCGADAIAGASFCDNCGEPLETAKAGAGDYASWLRKRPSYAIAVAILAIAAVVAVAIGLVPLLSGHGRDVGEGYEITYKGISSDQSELTAYLDGTAKNTTGGFADMDLLYYFHDADGEVIGIGIVRLEDVAPGESRGFSAPILPIDDRLSYSDPDGTKAKCKTWELIPPVVSN